MSDIPAPERIVELYARRRALRLELQAIEAEVDTCRTVCPACGGWQKPATTTDDRGELVHLWLCWGCGESKPFPMPPPDATK